MSWEVGPVANRIGLCVWLVLINPHKNKGGNGMKIRAPLHSIDVRGRFGVGVVFTTWRGLSVGRIFTVPTNPRSVRQLVIRGLMTAGSRAWAALTDGNRDGWETYSDSQSRKNIFGQDVRASGFNEYCALYVMASEVGETPVSVAPITAAPLQVTDGACESTAGGESFTLTWTDEQGGFVDLWMTGPLGPGRQPRESDYSHISFTPDATATVIPAGLTPVTKYGVRIRQVFANGQVGPPTAFIQATAAGA